MIFVNQVEEKRVVNDQRRGSASIKYIRNILTLSSVCN